MGEHARRDSRVAGNQPTRAFGEVSPDKTRLHAERAWLNFNVAKLPPPLRRCGLVHQTSRNLTNLDSLPRVRAAGEAPGGMALDFQKVLAKGDGDGFGAVGGAEFALDGIEVLVDGERREIQPLGDLVG